MYSNLNGTIEIVCTHVKVLENQLAQIASNSRAPSRVLQGKPEGNLREHVNVLETGTWFSLAETNLYRTATVQYTPTFITDRYNPFTNWWDDMIRKYFVSFDPNSSDDETKAESGKRKESSVFISSDRYHKKLVAEETMERFKTII